MKRAIVIGATSGIGRGLAEELAARGYRVGLVGRREALLREIAAADPAADSCAAPAYNASKAYQINYAEGLRQRVAKSGLPVTITDIRPGLVDTAMAKGEGLFWVQPVAKTVRQILRAVERRRHVAVVTRRWRIAAWLLRHLPESLYLKM